MTTKPNVGAEGAESANSSVSDVSVEDRVAELKKLVEEALAPIKSEISGIYSRQDKDRNQFREFMDEFKRLKGDNLSDEAAYAGAEATLLRKQKETERDQKLDEIYKKLFPSSDGNEPVSAAQVMKNAGLDLEDPAFEVLKERKYSNESELYADIGRLVAKKKLPSTAQETSSSKSETPGKTSDLIAELNALYKNPSVNYDRIDAIEKELGWT